VSVHARFVSVLTRIAHATNVQRTKVEDAVREETNGGSNEELSARLEAALPSLERIARRLEQV
jgi:hypothetical protein